MSVVPWQMWPKSILLALGTTFNPDVVAALAAVGIDVEPEYLRTVRTRLQSAEPPPPGTSLRRCSGKRWEKCGACGLCPVCKLLRTYPDSWVLDLGRLSDPDVTKSSGVSLSTVRRERIKRGLPGWPVGRPRNDFRAERGSREG